MAITVTNKLKRPMAYAIEKAEVGTKRRAGMLKASELMGASELRLIRNGTTIVTFSFSVCPVVNNDIVFTAAAATNTTYNTGGGAVDIDTGTWTADLVSVADATNLKISGSCGRTATDFTVSADIPNNGPVLIGTITFTLPSSLDANAFVDVVAINCGGPALLGASGRTYLADTHYVGGNAAQNTTGAIGNTVDDDVFRTERYGSVSYSIPVTNKSGADSYKVRLQMAENYSAITAAGQRVFTVRAQPGTANEVTQADIDIYEAVGGRGIAHELDMTVAVTASTLVIQTVAQVQEPLLNGIVVRSASGGAYSPPANPPSLPGGKTETTVIRSTSIAVPWYFSGMHHHRYPAANLGGSPSPTPTFRYGYRRSHNYDGTFWLEMHTGNGQYNWAEYDEWINSARNDGQRVLYNLFGTPAHLRWPGLEGATTPWGNDGRNTMPKDLAQVTAFLTAMIQRSNVGGDQKLHAIEVWNEPDPAGESTNGYFWAGSVDPNNTSTTARTQRLNDLALLHKTVYQAVKAADPTVLVVAPGWIPGGAAKDSSIIQAYFNRPISGGGTPLQFTDVLAMHPYTGSGETDGGVGASNIKTTVQAYVDAQRAVSSTMPLWGTEAGNESTYAGIDQHVLVIKRKGIISAALGVECLFWYSYESQYLGAPSDNTATSDALDEVHAKVAGKTMTRCSILNDGTVWATFADGTSWNI